MLALFALALSVVTGDTIIAGSTVVAGTSLPRGTIVKQLAIEDSGGVQILGTVTQQLSAATVRGVPGLLSVQTFQLGDRRTVDSSFVDSRTLRPIGHWSHNESRVMALDFDATRVTGTIVPASGATKTVDQSTAVATFDSNVADLVYAVLPLADGYTATVPTYVYEEGGLVWTDITVADAPPIAGEAVWRIRVHSATRDVEYWVSRTTRWVVRSRYQLAPGRTLRIERI